MQTSVCAHRATDKGQFFSPRKGPKESRVIGKRDGGKFLLVEFCIRTAASEVLNQLVARPRS